jgi:hypothetical protein
MTDAEHFQRTLREAGWAEAQPGVAYAKGTWRAVFDTSSWVEVGTEANPRVFDVPVPEARLGAWCIKLIEHLCAADDEIRRLKAT